MAFSGFDAPGRLLFGPAVLPKAATLRLDNVPVEVTTLRILYLDGSVPRYAASEQVQIQAGQTTVVEDPDLTELDAAVTALEIVPARLDLAAGDSATLIARATFSDGGRAEVTSLASWASGNTGIATVSNQEGSRGRVTAVGAGQTMVGASLGQLRTQAEVKVAPAEARALRVVTANGQAASTAVGATLALRAEVVRSNGEVVDLTSEAEWRSSNSDLARVDGGLVTGVAGGKADITAQLQDLSTPLEVAVTGAELLSLEITPGNSLMHKGLSKNFRAIGTYSDGLMIDLSGAADWDSGSDSVATVNSDGLVHAVGVSGTATTITAVFQEVEGEADVRVGAYLYAASSAGGIVRQPLADGGGFTGAQQTQFAGTIYREVLVNSSGEGLLALTSSQTVESFRINLADGGLTRVDSAVFAVAGDALSEPTSLALTPDDRLLYGTHRASTTIAGVAVNAETLELTGLGAVYTHGSGLEGLCLGSRGQFLFALSANDLLRFAVDGQSGALQALTPTFSGAPLSNPAFLQCADNGFLYAVNRVSEPRLCVLSTDVDGTVRSLSGAPPFSMPSGFIGTAMSRALVLKDGSSIYGLLGGMDGGIGIVNLNSDSGNPDGSISILSLALSSVGLTQSQGSDYVYFQADGGSPLFRMLRKGVLGSTSTSAPLSRSVSVTP